MNNTSFINNCIFCHSPASLQCVRCFDNYCSSDCQDKDWQHHRYFCFPKPALQVRISDKKDPRESSSNMKFSTLQRVVSPSSSDISNVMGIPKNQLNNKKVSRDDIATLNGSKVSENKKRISDPAVYARPGRPDIYARLDNLEELTLDTIFKDDITSFDMTDASKVQEENNEKKRVSDAGASGRADLCSMLQFKESKGILDKIDVSKISENQSTPKPTMKAKFEPPNASSVMKEYLEKFMDSANEKIYFIGDIKNSYLEINPDKTIKIQILDTSFLSDNHCLTAHESGKGYNIYYKTINKEITKVLRSGSQKLKELPAIDQLVLAKFQRVYYRSFVVQIEDTKKISVNYIDYGNTESVDLKQLRSMPGSLCEKPVVAKMCFIQNFDVEIASNLVVGRVVKVQVVNECDGVIIVNFVGA